MTWLVIHLEQVGDDWRVTGGPVEGDDETAEDNAHEAARKWESEDPVRRRAFAYQPR